MGASWSMTFVRWRAFLTIWSTGRRSDPWSTRRLTTTRRIHLHRLQPHSAEDSVARGHWEPHIFVGTLVGTTRSAQSDQPCSCCALVVLGAASAVKGVWRLIVEGPAVENRFNLMTEGVFVELELTVPPQGTSRVLYTDAPRLQTPDPRDIRFRVFRPLSVELLQGSSTG